VVPLSLPPVLLGVGAAARQGDKETGDKENSR
jgi:hypothetical protein